MRLSVVVMSLSIALMQPLASRAQTPQNDAYAESIRRALEEYSLGHWTEARTFFANAHALLPSARTLRGLALASYELRSYVDAIGFFERALAETEQALSGRMRAEAERFLAESRMFVTTLRVTLDPADARLDLDGKPVELEAGGTLRLDPGNHTLTAKAQGYETSSQNVVTRGGGEPLSVRLQLRAEASELVKLDSPGASGRYASAEPDARKGIGPWMVIGGSAAVAIAGGVFVGVAAASKSSAEDPGREPSYQDVMDAAARGRTFFPLGFALIGVGAAGIATGIVWKYWPLFGQSERTAVSFSPAGVLVHGRF